MLDKGFWTGFACGALCVAVGSTIGITVRFLQHESRGYVMSDPAHEARLESLEDLIDEYYLGETDDEKLADGIYKGLISGLDDRYSCYYTAEEYKAEAEDSQGTYEGIGIIMQALSDGTILVVECVEGGPGQLSGLKDNDIIIKMDDRDVTEMETDEVVEYIRTGSSGSVTLTILRGTGEDAEQVEVTVPVANVELPSVYTDILEEKTGYLQITEFKSVTYHQFCDALDKLIEDGIERLVIDVRDNPGGYVDVVCNILRRILPEGLIVYTEDKHGERIEEYGDGETPLSIPLAVLVNTGSASASEIFAGAVKDYSIGTIVGTTTYGKGVVQSIRAYPDGSAVKLTTSHYFTPKGTDIHEIGIEPDIFIENNEDSDEYSDAQLQKALEVLDNKVMEE